MITRSFLVALIGGGVFSLEAFEAGMFNEPTCFISYLPFAFVLQAFPML